MLKSKVISGLYGQKKLCVSLICDVNKALDLWINKSADGSISNVTIGAYSDNPDDIARVAGLLGHSHAIMGVEKSAFFNISGKGCLDEALNVVTNPYLGDLTYARFGHDRHGLYGYWDNKNLAALHQEIACFVPKQEGSTSREYLQDADRFWVHNTLNRVFGNTARHIAQGFNRGNDAYGAFTLGRARSAVMTLCAAR